MEAADDQNNGTEQNAEATEPPQPEPECNTCCTSGIELWDLGDPRAENPADRPHPICEGCIKRVFQMALDYEKHWPPFTNEAIDKFAHLPSFSAAFVAAYRQKEAYYSIRPKWTHRDYGNCNIFVGQYRQSIRGRPFPANCPNCNAVVCSGCGVTNIPDHKSFRRFNNDHGKGDFGTPSREVQRCPDCSIPVIPETGCNTMTCGECKASFCFLCGLEAREGSHHWDDLRGVCPKYSYPTPLEKENGSFNMPGWSTWDHEHIDHRTGLWRDPDRPLGLRNLDGTDWRSFNSEYYHSDRPCIHPLPEGEIDVAGTESDVTSDWANYVREFQQQCDTSDEFAGQLPRLLEGLHSMLVHPEHAQFIRHLIRGAHAAAAYLQKNLIIGPILDVDVRDQKLSDRLLFSHYSAYFRQLFTHLFDWPPIEYGNREGWRSLCRDYVDFWKLQFPLTLQEEVLSIPGTERSRLFNTFRTIARFISQTRPYHRLDRSDNDTLMGYRYENRYPSPEIAWRLKQIFDILYLEPGRLFEPAARVRIRRQIARLDRLCNIPEVEGWRDDEAEEHQKTLYKLTRAVLDHIFKRDELPPQAGANTRIQGQRIADREWIRDILDTLQPVVTDADIQTATATELLALDIFGIVHPMYAFADDLAQGRRGPSDNRLDQSLDLIEEMATRPGAWQGLDADILNHADYILQDMRGATEGIFRHSLR